VNGRAVASLAMRVDPQRDRVELDGQRIALPRQWRVYAFNKPPGVVSTLKPQKGQPCLAEYRRQAGLNEAIIPVGRLDAETAGLLLWTDDGVLAQALCRPDSRVWKRYAVRLNGPLTAEAARRLTSGRLELDGRPCRPARLQPAPPADGRRWIMEIHEGRKRQIRRMFALVGLKVTSLARVAIGPIELGRLREGCFRRLTSDQVHALRKAVGPI
jgi:23S rRNA pseudouridine2605 synthase